MFFHRTDVIADKEDEMANFNTAKLNDKNFLSFPPFQNLNFANIRDDEVFGAAAKRNIYSTGSCIHILKMNVLDLVKIR